jgi:L-lactate dehydrogenase complex protein LldG
MQESTSREKVLKAIRDAQVNSMNPPYVDEDYADKIYQRPEAEYDEVIFAEALARVGGQFVYCSSIDEFSSNLQQFLTAGDITRLHCYDENLQGILNDAGIFCYNVREEYHDCQAGITPCEWLVARLGSIVMSSRLSSGRRGYIWPHVHLVVAWKDQLVFDLRHAFAALKSKYAHTNLPSLVSVITGPSRTADIEKTLVMGAHGPAKLLVFFIDQPSYSAPDVS